MSLLLRRKVESALVAYLQSGAATIGVASGNIVSANGQTERPDPALVVIALESQADDDIPQAATVKVRLQYHSTGTVGGSERSAVDTVIEKVHTFLMKPVDDNATWSDANPEAGALRAALNKPASGADNRTIQPLHIYDFRPSEDNGDVISEGWIDELVYDVVCQPMNSH